MRPFLISRISGSPFLSNPNTSMKPDGCRFSSMVGLNPSSISEGYLTIALFMSSSEAYNRKSPLSAKFSSTIKNTLRNRMSNDSLEEGRMALILSKPSGWINVSKMHPDGCQLTGSYPSRLWITTDPSDLTRTNLSPQSRIEEALPE